MQLGSVTVQKARKPHRCWWCDGRIEPGELYARWLWKEPGESPLAVEVHPECRAAWNTLEYGENEVAAGEHCRGCTCEHGFCECGKESK
jgi:hypothetical protein